MVILGIDQSYKSSGFCITENNTMIDFGIFRTSDKDGDIFDRCWKITNWIEGLIKTNNITHIGIEGLAFGIRGSATRDLAGLQFSLITRIQCQLKIPTTIVTPLTLKKFATTSGKAQKEEMIAHLPEEVLTKFRNANLKKTTGLSDVTDAFWITKYVHHTHFKE